MDLRIGFGSLALLTAILSLACSVGDPGNNFTTFGNPTDSGPVGNTSDGTETGSRDTDGDSGVMTGSMDGASSGTDSVDGPTCTPSDEVCDGEDNDCDGEIDDGNPESGAPCDSGMPGNCASGTTACEGGAVVCVPEMAAMPETCNGLDDDCNGMIDDGNPESGQACNTGMPGVCSDGLGECMMGVLACNPIETASAEVCDNQDNDCDGAIDNGNPGGGGACATGLPGICSAGTNQCNAGVVACQQNQMAAPDETCNNGLDDDCNGQVDDGCSSCAHDICLTGIALTIGCDPCVTSICGVDPFCCSNSWDSICVGHVLTVCGIVC